MRPNLVITISSSLVAACLLAYPIEQQILLEVLWDVLCCVVLCCVVLCCVVLCCVVLCCVVLCCVVLCVHEGRMVSHLHVVYPRNV